MRPHRLAFCIGVRCCTRSLDVVLTLTYHGHLSFEYADLLLYVLSIVILEFIPNALGSYLLFDQGLLSWTEEVDDGGASFDICLVVFGLILTANFVPSSSSLWSVSSGLAGRSHKRSIDDEP